MSNERSYDSLPNFTAADCECKFYVCVVNVREVPGFDRYPIHDFQDIESSCPLYLGMHAQF